MKTSVEAFVEATSMEAESFRGSFRIFFHGSFQVFRGSFYGSFHGSFDRICHCFQLIFRKLSWELWKFSWKQWKLYHGSFHELPRKKQVVQETELVSGIYHNSPPLPNHPLKAV